MKYNFEGVKIFIGGVEIKGFANAGTIEINWPFEENMRKLRKCFKYVKTEFPAAQLKVGDIFSMEPTDPEDTGCDPEEVFIVRKDAEPYAEGGTRLMSDRMISDSSYTGIPEHRKEDVGS